MSTWSRRMRWGVLLLALLAAAPLPAAAAAAADTAAFLERARHPAGQSTYAKLEGLIQHRASGGPMETYPVYLGILIHPRRTQAELLLDGREGYLIDRVSGADNRVVTRTEALNGKGYPDSLAERYHLRPGDLATGFLFYDLVREEDSESVKGIPCRVLVLTAPDKSETVKAYLARDYAFALKAEFFKNADCSGSPERTLESASFQKKNGLYYAELINLYGDKWRTRIHFTRAEVGPVDPASPPGAVFRMAKPEVTSEVNPE